MKINKQSNSTYTITDLVRTNKLKELFDLFNIDNTSNSDNQITIKNVTSLKTFSEWESSQKHDLIDYLQAEALFDNFAAISLYLEKVGLQLSTLDSNNIIVINDMIFIPTNMNDLYEIKNNTITVNSPYSKKNPYLSLELQTNDKIPYQINYKCFYSSLALLIYKKMLDKENKNYLHGLRPIFGSRLYWMLRYCLLENPEERLIVII